ncbi:MAG: TraM recognition domain-containing protein [Leucobacter sp.]|nr:TraM recognition domain-containing protein [Leucobacter sp.]
MRPTLKWSTLPAGLALGLVIAGTIALVTVPQAVAVLLTAPGRFRGEGRLSLFDLFPMWLRTDPTVVTGATSPAWVHHLIAWGLLANVVILSLLLAVFVFKRSQDPQRRQGLASVHDAEKALGAKNLVKQHGPNLRPSLRPVELKPEDCGYKIGEFFGRELWLRVEDPTILIGPSRAGKGWYLVLNWIMSAPGAVITTSSKTDNALLTMKARERMHPGSTVWVFAPGVEGGEALGHVLRWNPIPGCENEEVLIRRIHALIPKDAFSGSTTNGGHWDTLGQQLGAALFHAAACIGASVDTIWEWVSIPQRAMEAVKAIREHPDGLYEYANHLESVINMPPDQRAAQWGVLPTSLAFLSSRVSRKWMKPEEGANIDLKQFVKDKGTLYLVGDKQVSGGYVRIIDGLLAEIDHVTKSLAIQSEGNRLDPPITYLLDEAGNFEYRGLYELITAGGGQGRVGVAVFQSKDQLKQYGAESAGALWDAAVAKIILPGGADEAELRGLSQLIGEQWVKREQHSWGVGPSSVSVSEEKRAIIEAKDIREMPAGYALLFYRNLKPVIPKLKPFNENPVYSECQEDAKVLTARVREYARARP